MSLAIDVLIIGGGPAGLATALALCRARHTCVVFDSGTYRNSLCQYMHSVPPWDLLEYCALTADSLGVEELATILRCLG